MRIHAVTILLLQGREKEHINNFQILPTSTKLSSFFYGSKTYDSKGTEDICY